MSVKTNKKVSVVILNWNGRDLLERFLPYIIKYTDRSLADIIVADNDSSDESVTFVQENYFNIVKIIQLDQNYGFAEGYNIVLKKINSKYVVFLNSDVEVSANWLEPLVKSLDDNINIGAVQPKIRSQKNKNYFEYAGASGGFIDRLGYPFCRGRIFDYLEKDNGQYEAPINIFWASGACFMIRSQLYFEVGGLDKTFFAHMEEIDLCWRLNARGYYLQCIPQSTVYHVGGATLAENSPQKTFLNFRNNLLMLYKNLTESEFKTTYKVRVILDYLAAFQLLLSGKKDNFSAILNAHTEFKQIKKEYNSIRDNNLKLTINKNISTIYSKSILWQYFVRKKKVFCKLKF